jgi:hypothetical protein
MGRSCDYPNSSKNDGGRYPLFGTSTHQYGPETPNLKAVALDCSKVAAQVHAETILAAISPVLTEREADVNSSFVFTENCVYLSWIKVMPSMTKAKPMPRAMTTAQPAAGSRTCAEDAGMISEREKREREERRGK